MHDKKEKPFRRHEIFILGLMVGFTASITVIMYHDELIMPKIILPILLIVMIVFSLYFIHYDDKFFKP